ncbi:macro domain-containing protein [Pseudomonas sp.]|uniref:macro domain-containing protein n=1 Tax=Pseudomonas sp. TaxID=306 RepID=UPI00262069C8|nr:macro domain-containing protein [Pseudomonas sp.]
MNIPEQCKYIAGFLFLLSLLIYYLISWYAANRLKVVDLDIEGSTVTVKAGDLFKEPDFKVIAFNEYFDTQVDNKIISDKSLNGIFIKEHLPGTLDDLERCLEEAQFEDADLAQLNEGRRAGKKQKYELGTLCVYEDFILAAFAKFDDTNKAVLTMPEYLGFLIRFWDKINVVYAQKSVSVPVFGSGITRIKEHRHITDEDLLKIMLWTFRISEMRFNYPAKLTIVVHEDKIDQVNLLDFRMAKNGL